MWYLFSAQGINNNVIAKAVICKIFIFRKSMTLFFFFLLCPCATIWKLASNIVTTIDYYWIIHYRFSFCFFFYLKFLNGVWSLQYLTMKYFFFCKTSFLPKFIFNLQVTKSIKLPLSHSSDTGGNKEKEKPSKYSFDCKFFWPNSYEQILLCISIPVI